MFKIVKVFHADCKSAELYSIFYGQPEVMYSIARKSHSFGKYLRLSKQCCCLEHAPSHYCSTPCVQISSTLLVLM